ncbi:xanthine dehydrogenase family protein subunit M [Bacillus sp. AFS017336]|uniref:FAD binding domain-containing protein n=1 Tax=Bacillus sp. AFS017336 TaxID=2033489 RepID=UPI000BF21C8A|nr:FAD binding domain-containing protein [Bacillus sp. AFS017336]PEK99030.1 xanthine dehydrogenase [Bacillus sp. AFS017336]
MIRKGDASLYYPSVWFPDSLEKAYILKQQFYNNSCYIAGGTLLQTHWEKGIQCPENLISIENIKDMKEYKLIRKNDQTFIQIGALTTLDCCRNNPIFLEKVPLLVEAVRNIASPAVRHRATIGGNIANRHGDVIPALIVLDAHLTLYDGNELLVKQLSECIKDSDFLSNSILVSISIPVKKKKSNDYFFYKKIGLREVFCQSIVTISGYFKMNEKKVMEQVRLVVCGNSFLPQRLVNTEEYIKGLFVPSVQLKEIANLINKEFKPPSDHFSSSNYKQAITTNIIVSEIAKLPSK